MTADPVNKLATDADRRGLVRRLPAARAVVADGKDKTIRWFEDERPGPTDAALCRMAWNGTPEWDRRARMVADAPATAQDLASLTIINARYQVFVIVCECRCNQRPDCLWCFCQANQTKERNKP